MGHLRTAFAALLPILIFGVTSCAAEPAAPAPPAGVHRGEIIYQTDFDKDPPQVGPAPLITLDKGVDGSQALLTEQPREKGAGNVRWRIPLDLNLVRGNKVQCEAQIKAEDVAVPPQHFQGVKFMLMALGPDKQIYAQQNDVSGTFDWKPVKFSATVPASTTEAWLVFGLENTTGKAWFDNVKVTTISVPRKHPAQPAAGPMYTGHDVPRLRGCMVSPSIKEEDLRVLGGQWKANELRWQLTWLSKDFDGGTIDDPESYDKWIDRSLARLDALLPVCRELGMVVTLDLHSMPGGSQKRINRIFLEKRWQDEFIKTWQHIAEHYKGNPTIWGYDMANEPIEVWGDITSIPDGLMNWQALATRTAQTIRAIDPKHTIIMEPAPGAESSGFSELEPLPVSGVVYSVHVYNPHEFTHQGVGGYPKGPVYYPGEINGQKWDKEQMRRNLQAVRDFQKDYNVQIYVGEFSAIRWAPDDTAYNYLRDSIDLFEEYGWDWNYHAFREYNGWSVESGPDPADGSRQTTSNKRKDLLLSWFSKNAKAGIDAEVK